MLFFLGENCVFLALYITGESTTHITLSDGCNNEIPTRLQAICNQNDLIIKIYSCLRGIPISVNPQLAAYMQRSCENNLKCVLCFIAKNIILSMFISINVLSTLQWTVCSKKNF